MTAGISARDLSDDDLRRELAHLKEKTEDIDAGGTPAQQANHRSRTAELEEEFLRRYAPTTHDHAHTSAGADDDVAPAGPDDGPVDDQPRTDASDEETAASSEPQPSDAPTNDPSRPANPA